MKRYDRPLMFMLRRWSQEMRSSFWFTPGIIVLCSVGLASLLVTIDARLPEHLFDRWPLLFGAGAAGARGLLSAVAGSMITVAGVVFSITIVALSLTSSQYTSRVLRNFMRDRINQIVLGVFVGVFAYCLVVLRTIRGGDEGAFVPSLAVFVGLLLAFVGIGFLIFFIHHISLSIQASSIIAAATDETIAAVDRLFPTSLGEGVDDEPDGEVDAALAEMELRLIAAEQTGYIESVDGEALLAFARDRKTVLRMERGVGDFVVQGSPLIAVGGDAPTQESAAELNSAFQFDRQRTVQQDAGFGIRQIVDIAMKALSPGINDSTTAIMCVDYLAAVLVRLTSREIPSSRRADEGIVRLLACGPTFAGLLAEAFDQIRQNAGNNVAVLVRLLESLETVARQTTAPSRRRALRRQADLVIATAERSVVSQERSPIDAAAVRLRDALDPPPATC